MNVHVMTGPDEGTTLLDVRRAAFANLALLDKAANVGMSAPGSTRGVAMVNGPATGRESVNALRDTSLRAIALIDDYFPDATDEELSLVRVDVPLLTINGKKKGKGDLEQLWNEVQPALSKAADDVLKNDIFQSVARNNPVMAAARAAFQIAVQENAGGIADQLHGDAKAMANAEKVWTGLGGNWSTLRSSIAKGQSKKAKGAIAALPHPWEMERWRNMGPLEIMREVVPAGMDPAWFQSPAIFGGPEPSVPDIPSGGGGGGGGGGGWLAGVLKAAGPIVETVLNSVGQQPSKEVKEAIDAGKDGKTKEVQQHVLDSLLKMGLDQAKANFGPAPKFLGPPSPPRRGTAVAVRRVAPPRGFAQLKSTRKKQDWLLPAALVFAAVTFSKSKR